MKKDEPQEERSELEKALTKRILLKLLRTGDGEKDTRQRQPKKAILSLARDNSEKQEILRELIDGQQGLVKGRLLVIGESEQETEAWIDLAHDVLIEGWETLNEWRNGNREIRLLEERIEKAYQEWVNHQKDSKYLLDGILREEAHKNLQQLKDLSVSANLLNFCERSFAVFSFETGIDYRELDQLLKFRHWQDADIETARLMLRAAKCETKGWMWEEDIERFPCEDLRKINQLWLQYSERYFGLSVQKEIYQTLGGTSKYNQKIWQQFCERIGWRQENSSVSNSVINYDLNSPSGHFPVLETISGLIFWAVIEGEILFLSRAKTCKLQDIATSGYLSS